MENLSMPQWIAEVNLTSDLLTIAGGLILASEAWTRLAHLRALFGMLRLLKINDIAQFSLDEQIFRSEEDLQKIFARRAALRAIVGALLLALGSVGILAVDGFEVFH